MSEPIMSGASIVKASAMGMALVTAAELGALMMSPDEPIILFLPLSFLLVTFIGTMFGTVLSKGQSLEPVMAPQSHGFARFVKATARIGLFGMGLLAYTFMSGAVVVLLALGMNLTRVVALLVAFLAGAVAFRWIPKFAEKSGDAVDWAFGRFLK